MQKIKPIDLHSLDTWTLANSEDHDEMPCKILFNISVACLQQHTCITRKFVILFDFILYVLAVIFLPARPASQTYDSHKRRMILNHESPAGGIKNCEEKSAFSICNFGFECFLLGHRVLNNIGKNRYRKTPQQYSDHYFPWETRVYRYAPM